MTPELGRLQAQFGEMLDQHQRDLELAQGQGLQAETRIKRFEEQSSNGKSGTKTILLAEDDKH